MIGKSTCQNCGGDLEFDVEDTGKEIECPHCHQTILLRAAFRPAPPKSAPLPQQVAAAPGNLTTCPDCAKQVSRRARFCPNCGAPVSFNQVSHTLVWVNAFVPLFAILIDAILVSIGCDLWLGVPIVVGINVLLLSKDEEQLKAQGLPIKDLGSAWLVPVYLFKRVRVAGGGYGYAVCWMITFFISILSPSG
jgi:DNA-directed RNA polymerase subunit RPC12/RpoP